MLKIRSFLIVSIIVSFLVGGLSGFLSGLLILDWSSSNNQNFLGVSNLVRSIVEKPSVTSVTSTLVYKSDSEKLVEAVKKTSPSVVSIIVTKNLPLLDGLINDLYLPPELKLETPGQTIGEKNNKQSTGIGSGFIVRSNGLIITNRHVVSDLEAEYTVVLNDGKRYPALVLAKDQLLDLALIKIEAKNLPVLSLGNSDKLEIGQTVVAIGNTLGQFQNTVTSGIISGVKRRLVADGLGVSEVIESAIQTDAAINPGNSGGPLLNLQGEVVGINTAVDLGSQSVGFALPINTAKIIIESVEKYGHIVRPWLGVRYVLLNKEMAEQYNLSLDYGALVVKGSDPGEIAVIPESPAEKAGIVENDIILEVNGQKVSEEYALGALINKYKVGQEISLRLWHKGEIKNIKIKLEEAIRK